MTIASIIVCALLGALSWTFLEYVIHRSLGHDRRFRPNPFGAEHLRHHVEGDYFAPATKKIPLALAAALVFSAPAMWLLGRAQGLAFVGGLMAFYTAYEVLHRREHTHPGFGAYGRWARRHHFHHHFVDARCNHGVTSPFWDLLFGTYQKPSTITVPPRLCMIWLKDPATGKIRTEHAPSFVLGKSHAEGER